MNNQIGLIFQVHLNHHVVIVHGQGATGKNCLEWTPMTVHVRGVISTSANDTCGPALYAVVPILWDEAAQYDNLREEAKQSGVTTTQVWVF